jgi:trimeric autotransporter adhesin
MKKPLPLFLVLICLILSPFNKVVANPVFYIKSAFISIKDSTDNKPGKPAEGIATSVSTFYSCTNPVIAPVPTGPAASLYLSYAFSGNANDLSGNSNNGILEGAPTLTTDRYGNANSAYTFNGSSQYVATTTQLLTPGPQNFTISIWIKTSTAGGTLVDYGNSPTAGSGQYDRNLYMSSTGQIYFGVYSGGFRLINTTAGYADGNWHNVVATLSSANGANLYVDGILLASDVTMPLGQSDTRYWRIGYDDNTWPNASTNNYFTGVLDDVAIYTSELTAAQVSTLFGASASSANCGGTISLQVNSVTGATYSWTGPNSFVSTSQNPSITNATAVNAGAYTVTVMASGGCTSSLTVTAAVSSGGPILSTAPTGPMASLYLSYAFAGNAKDISGNANNGILENTPTLTTGHFADLNSAYLLNGSSQYIATTTPAATNPTSISISMWFKTSTAGGTLADFGSQTGGSGGYDRILYMSSAGQLYFGVYAGGFQLINTASGTNYADGKWHHVVATMGNSMGASLYMDGVLAANNATLPAGQNATRYWRFGYENSNWTNATANGYFTGAIDDVAVYNTTLTLAQVAVLYGIGGSTFCSGGSLSLTANTVAGANYDWTGPGGFTSTAQNPTIANPVSGTYTLVAYNSGGCSSTLSLAVTTNSIAYTGSPYTFPVGTAITSLTPTIAGTPSAFTTSPSLPAGLSINSAGVISGTPTTQTATADYMVIATFGSCTSTSTIRITVPVANYNWTGTTSTDWSIPGNWATGVVPTVNTSATIPATTNQPNVTAASSCYSLIVTGNTTIKLSAALTVTNGINLNGGNLAFSGTSSATFGGASNVGSGNTLTTNSGSTVSFNSTTLTFANGSSSANTTALTNSGTLNLNSTTLTEGNYETINNTGAININGATLVLANAVTSFTTPVYGTNFTTGGDSYSLTNSGTITTNNNGTLTLNDVGTIYNTGKLITGTSGSAATLNISGNGSAIVNTGTFLIGSTSVVNLTGGSYSYSSGIANSSVTNNSGGTFALMSDANGSATISQITNGGVFTGNFYVQRYLPAASSNGYRLLSLPVYGGTSSSPATNYLNLSYLNATTPAINGTTYAGAETGGPSGSANGFSLANVYSTMYLYDEAIIPATGGSLNFFNGKNVGLTQITSTTVSYNNTQLAPATGSVSAYAGTGYTFYYIGPSTGYSTTRGVAINPTTISYNGQINQSNITFYNPFAPTGNLSYTTGTGTTYVGYNLVGNPYASTIDLNKFAADNFTTGTVTFYELNDNQNFCAWTYNTSNSTGTSDGTSVQYIASGQGFYVLATATGQSVTFKEDQKVNTAAPANFLALRNTQTINNDMLASTNRPVLQLQGGGSVQTGLHLMLAKDSAIFKTCGIFFNSAWSDKLDGNDAKDIDGINPKIYFSSYTADGTRTSINAMANYNEGKNIKLYVSSTADGSFTMSLMNIANVDTTTFNIYLFDNYKKDTINIGKNKTYTFNIANADTTTFGGNRFVLSIQPKISAPYRLLSFNGIKNTASVALTWKTNNEGSSTGFGVQKYNAETKAFKTIDTLQSNSGGAYTCVDQSPVLGSNTYRLIQNNAVGSLSYTNALVINFGTSGMLSVYPNPAANVITVNLTSITSSITENYDVTVFDSMGVMVMQKSVSGDAVSQDVSTLKPGVYFVDVKSKYGNSIGAAKFIKN